MEFDSLEMSLASQTGTCMFEYKDNEMASHFPVHKEQVALIEAAAVNVSVGGDETITLAPFYTPMIEWIYKALAWAPRATAPISIGASAVILWVILRDRSKLAKTRYRMLFGMSVVDVLNSIALGLSSAPTPAGTFGAYQAIGNRATCTAQGFFVQLGFAEPAYSSTLSLYFVLVIHFRMRENTIRRRVEPIMHAFAILYPLGTAVAGLWLELFNSSLNICWIEPYPIGCTYSMITATSCHCTRGKNAFIYQLAFGGAPLALIFIINIVAMIFIMVTVRRIKRRERMLNLGRGVPSARNAHQVKAAAMSTQAFLYILGFLMTYTCPIVLTIATEVQVDLHPAWHIMTNLLLPLQGLWNFVAFIHPRWKFARSRNPRASKWKVFKLSLEGDRGERRDGRAAGGVSAFNGEFQQRQFQIGTESMRSSSGQEIGGNSSYDYNSWPSRRRVESSTYSSYFDDSEGAVDLGRAISSQTQLSDPKVKRAEAGLGALDSREVSESRTEGQKNSVSIVSNVSDSRSWNDEGSTESVSEDLMLSQDTGATVTYISPSAREGFS